MHLYSIASTHHQMDCFQFFTQAFHNEKSKCLVWPPIKSGNLLDQLSFQYIWHVYYRVMHIRLMIRQNHSIFSWFVSIFCMGNCKNWNQGQQESRFMNHKECIYIRDPNRKCPSYYWDWLRFSRLVDKESCTPWDLRCAVQPYQYQANSNTRLFYLGFDFSNSIDFSLLT